MRTWLAALAALAIGAILAGFLYVLTAPYLFTTASAPALPPDGIGWQSWARVSGTQRVAQVLVPDEYDRGTPEAARGARTPAR